jgi:hypothetical protein
VSLIKPEPFSIYKETDTVFQKKRKIPVFFSIHEGVEKQEASIFEMLF